MYSFFTSIGFLLNEKISIKFSIFAFENPAKCEIFEQEKERNNCLSISFCRTSRGRSTVNDLHHRSFEFRSQGPSNNRESNRNLGIANESIENRQRLFRQALSAVLQNGTNLYKIRWTRKSELKFNPIEKCKLYEFGKKKKQISSNMNDGKFSPTYSLNFRLLTKRSSGLSYLVQFFKRNFCSLSMIFKKKYCR